MNFDQLLRFYPILKPKIWGGTKLASQLGKQSEQKNIGESWEIADLDSDISVVSNGDLKGKTLRAILRTHKATLVGEKVYRWFGEKFPLLIKFIDAKAPLSIQLHPNDDLAKKRHHSSGKTEMWYVMQADKDANLIVGFQQDTSQQTYLNHLEKNTLPQILKTAQVSPGDAYFIPPGTVHAIGAGVLLAEIQQPSAITYRVYDWNRKDAQGNYRTLHTNQALDAIDYKAQKSYKIAYKKEINQSSQMVCCPYFTTAILTLQQTTSMPVKLSKIDSFVIYMCVKGSVTIQHKAQSEVLSVGQTLLVPASVCEITITAIQSAELLSVYIE